MVTKGNWKNKLWYGSKLSQYKTEKVLKCFADGKSTSQTAAETKISLTTIKTMFQRFRIVLLRASLTYRYLFHGAGVILMFGYPPCVNEVSDKVNKRWQRGGKSINGFFFEELIRRYTSYSYSKEQITIITILALAHHTRKYRVLIREFSYLPLELGFRPEDDEYTVMDAKSFLNSKFGNIVIDDYIKDVWKDTHRGAYKIPDYVWIYLEKGRERFSPNETIYRDLRWYLLKHPINGRQSESSNYWEDMPKPPMDRFGYELKYLFDILRELKSSSTS